MKRMAAWILLIGVIAALAAAGRLVGLYIDWLWFGEIGFRSVFTTVLLTQVALGLGFGVLVFAVTYVNAALALRWGPRDVVVVVDDALGIPRPELLIPVLRPLALPASLLAGILAGWAASGQWALYLRGLNPTAFGVADPLFGRDIAFYVFSLPLLRDLYGWVLLVLGLAAVVAAAVYVGNRGIEISPVGPRILSMPRAHLLVLVGLFLLAKAGGYFLDGYDLLYSERAVAFGAGYTDVTVRLPVLRFLAALAALAGLLAFASVRLPSWRPLGLGVALLVLAAVVGGGALPAVIQRLQVVPNEIAKETPYIQRTIRYTRLAYGLDNIEEREFPAQEALSLRDIRNNAPTIRNVRLWDSRPLLSTYSQLQEIRTYYKFTDIDIDRYRLDGEYRQVTLSARELSYKDLPSRIWINERLTYTHGYGAVVGPVNRVTPEGLPEFFVKDIPPAEGGGLAIRRPDLYFSEGANDYVFVRTNAKEFHYPAGEKNVYTVYEGSGGVPVGSPWRKALLALRFADVRILFSSDITAESRILLYRQIKGRVGRVAPFLRYDADPYLVVSRDGRLFWMLDAYTTSDMFPYSARTRGWGNYVRNAVKVTVDAYNGTLAFYVADVADPLVRTYARIFPGLLHPLERMPEDLQAHIRYPEDLFKVQARLYALYHMRDPQVFHNKEDLWAIPARAGERGEEPMEPYYLIMRLPGEPREEFILLLPFTPSRKDNMGAWLAARTDPPNYGKLIVYVFPKQRLIYGPRQIEARIDQDSFISQQLTLWSQRGSQVIRGNLLAIPIERSLMYVQPLYLAAEKGQLPELKRVIVAFGNQIAMEETLEASLQRVFGGGPPVPAAAAAATPPRPGASIRDLVEEAARAFARSLESQRALDWPAYGQEVKRLADAIRRLQEAVPK